MLAVTQEGSGAKETKEKPNPFLLTIEKDIYRSPVACTLVNSSLNEAVDGTLSYVHTRNYN